MSEVFSPPPAPPVAPSSDERTLALITHLSCLFTGFIVPLIIWLVHKDRPDRGFVADQAKEALNFCITAILAGIVSAMLVVVLIGFLLLPLLGLAVFVLCILAAIKANEGVAYRYPFALRLIK